MNTKYFRWDDVDITYYWPYEVAAFLDENPAAAEDFLEGELELIRACVAEGEMQTPREIFDNMVEALAIHREHMGKPVLR